MKQDIQDKLKEIKSRFRLMMNGVASRSMRDKGLGYKINWGIGLPSLKEMAQDYGKDYDLAVELWKEDIRECRILATMIMPVDKMSPDIVRLWACSLCNQEIAEIAAFNVFRYLDDAKNTLFAGLHHAMKWKRYVDITCFPVCSFQVKSWMTVRRTSL